MGRRVGFSFNNGGRMILLEHMAAHFPSAADEI
jgi:hypothetical protein